MIYDLRIGLKFKVQSSKLNLCSIFQSFNLSIFQFLSLILFTILFSFKVNAQDGDIVNDPNIKDLIENISEDAQTDEDYSSLLDDLEFYKKHPLNINTAKSEELEQLHYLSPAQIINLLEHIKQNGKLLALEELQTIDGFDQNTVSKITPYITIGEAGEKPHVSLKEMFKEGDNTITFRTQRVLEPQSGFAAAKDSTADSNSYYLGSPNLYYLQYKFNYQNRVRWGITAEKGAGEQFFKGTQPYGFDFYSAHFFLKNFGYVKALAIGDYQAQFGQGLTMWTGLVFSPSTDIARTRRIAKGISAYASRTENLFLRGAATTIGFKNIELTALVSYNKIDANYSYIDSLGNSTDEENADFIEYTTNTSGYHRTYNELDYKYTNTQKVFGGNIRYKLPSLSLGLTAVSYSYEIQNPSIVTSFASPYNMFYQGIDHGINIGADYNYVFHNFNFYGELTRSQNNAYAFVSGVLASIDKNVVLSLFYRNITKDFINPFSNPYRQNSTVVDERGFYISSDMKLTSTLALYGLMDIFSFPWLKYQVNAPSSGKEELIQLTYTPTKKIQLYIRYRNKAKETNTSDDLTMKYTEPYNLQTFRFNIRYNLSDAITLDGRFEKSIYKQGDNDAELGYILYQDINYSPMKSKLSFDARFMLFDAASYDARLYVYENDFFYYIPSFYEKGIYSYFMMNYDVVRHVSLGVKVGRIVYTNKDVISSGLDEITGNAKTTFKMQLKISF